MYDFGYAASGEYSEYSPWYSYKDHIEAVQIKSGVTSIGDYAFLDCNTLTAVSIPDTVASIGDLAFCWCGELTAIKIPDSVTTIREAAVRTCSVSELDIPDSVTAIGNHAFSYNEMTTVDIPASVTHVGKAIFEHCASLTEIIIDGRSSIPPEWDPEWNMDCDAKIIFNP